MATFQKRGSRWRAIVRKKGHPSQSKIFSTRRVIRTDKATCLGVICGLQLLL